MRFFYLLFLLISAQHVVGQKYAIGYDFTSNFYYLQDIRTGICDTTPYDNITWTKGFYLLEQQGKHGLLNNQGDTLIPFDADDIIILYDFIRVFYISKPLNERYEIYDLDFKLQFKNSSKHRHVGEYFILGQNGMLGVVNESLEVVIPYQFSDIIIYIGASGKYRFLCRKGSEEGVWDANGEVLIPFTKQILSIVNHVPIKYGTLEEYQRPPYIVVGQYSEPMTFGVYDENGKLVIPPIYENIYSSFQNETFCVQKNGKFGYINAKNKIVIPFQYDSALPFRNGKASVEFNGKFGVIDIHHNIVIPFDSYSNHFIFRNGISVFSKQEGKEGLIDSTGQVIQPPLYKSIVYVESQDYYRCMSNGTFILDRNGKTVLTQAYERVASIRKPTQDPTFDSNTKFLVSKNGKFGVIDAKENVIIDLKYDWITEHDCILTYTYNKLHGLLSETFEIISEPQYVAMRVNSNMWISVVDQEGKQYILDLNGHKI
jgi:hypothetical protein